MINNMWLICDDESDISFAAKLNNIMKVSVLYQLEYLGDFLDANKQISTIWYFISKYNYFTQKDWNKLNDIFEIDKKKNGIFKRNIIIIHWNKANNINFPGNIMGSGFLDETTFNTERNQLFKEFKSKFYYQHLFLTNINQVNIKILEDNLKSYESFEKIQTLKKLYSRLNEKGRIQIEWSGKWTAIKIESKYDRKKKEVNINITGNVTKTKNGKPCSTPFSEEIILKYYEFPFTSLKPSYEYKYGKWKIEYDILV